MYWYQKHDMVGKGRRYDKINSVFSTIPHVSVQCGTDAKLLSPWILRGYQIEISTQLLDLLVQPESAWIKHNTTTKQNAQNYLKKKITTEYENFQTKVQDSYSRKSLQRLNMNIMKKHMEKSGVCYLLLLLLITPNQK